MSVWWIYLPYRIKFSCIRILSLFKSLIFADKKNDANIKYVHYQLYEKVYKLYVILLLQ